ncbi:MAG: hypothetical protein KAH44_05685, partial [Oricola sp.]|nr:hypothetical protein [Oricola sp.]
MRHCFFVLALQWPGAAFAEDCATFWERGFPDLPLRTSGVYCAEVTPGSGPVIPHAIYAAEAIAGDPAVLAQIETIASGLKAAAALYET